MHCEKFSDFIEPDDVIFTFNSDFLKSENRRYKNEIQQRNLW